MHSEPDEPPDPDLRPLLRFIRRPAFAAVPPGRLTLWNWLGWQGLLMLALLLGGLFDRILSLAFHWPLDSVQLGFLGHPSWAAATVLLAAPALEELGFRAFLSTAPKLVFTGLAFFATYVFLFIHQNVTPVAIPMSPTWVLARYVHAFWIILPAGAISLLLYRYRREAVLGFFRRRAGWVFWTSCIVFAAGHNRLYTNGLEWWGFALVVPQFLAGVGLAYVRTGFGLRWSIVSHYAIDIPFVGLRWLYALGASSALLHGLFVALSFALLAMVGYGLVILRRVVRLRW